MAERTHRTALIAGATGLIGHHLLYMLLQHGVYKQVKALVRRPMELEHDKLQTIIADFDKLESVAEHFKVDDVFCCLGTTMKKAGSKKAFRKVDHDYPLEIARLAREQGAQQYLIVTALGTDKNSMIFYNQVKGEVETALQHMDYPALHIFQPSLLLGNRNESRPGESIGQSVARVFNPLLAGPLRKYRGIEGRTVAGAMLQTALQNDEGVHVHPSDDIQRTFNQSPFSG